MSRPTGCSSQSGVWWVCKGPDRTGEEKSQRGTFAVVTSRPLDTGARACRGKQEGTEQAETTLCHQCTGIFRVTIRLLIRLSLWQHPGWMLSFILNLSARCHHHWESTTVSHRQSSRKQIIEGHEFRAPHGAIKMHFSFSQGSKNPWCSATNPLSLIPQFHRLHVFNFTPQSVSIGCEKSFHFIASSN